MGNGFNDATSQIHHADTPGKTEQLAVRSSSRPRRPIKRYVDEMNAPAGPDKKVNRSAPLNIGKPLAKSVIDEEEADGQTVEKVLKKRVDGDGRVEYFVKWEGLHSRWNAWKPRDVLKHLDVVRQYEKEQKAAEQSKHGNFGEEEEHEEEEEEEDASDEEEENPQKESTRQRPGNKHICVRRLDVSSSSSSSASEDEPGNDKGEDESDEKEGNLGEEEEDEEKGEDEEEEDREEYVVERILAKRMNKNGEVEYLVKWQGCSDKMNSWEQADAVKQSNVFKQFESAADVERAFLASSVNDTWPKLMLSPADAEQAFLSSLKNSPNWTVTSYKLGPSADAVNDGGNQNIVNASPPVSSKPLSCLSLLTLTWSIDLFERRRFINGNSKAMCKLCGDSMGVDLETLIRHIATNENRQHQAYVFKLLRKQLELGFPNKSSVTQPSLVLTDFLLFVRPIWAIDLFERRQFLNRRTKALCKLCGDSLSVDLEALIRHIATNEDPQHLQYALKLLQKQLDSAIAQPRDQSAAAVPTMHILVRLLTGKSVTLEVEAGNTVVDLKELIEAKEGIPSGDQRLIYDGIRLEEGRTLADYNIRKGSAVQLLLCLHGG